MDDIFASTASKYKFLFQLTDRSKILFIGNQPTDIIADFRRHFVQVTHVLHCSNVHLLAASGDRYGLVWLDETELGDHHRHLSILRLVSGTLLTERGSLIVTAMNALSVRRIKAFLKLRPAPPGTLTPWLRRLQLRRAEFQVVDTFLVHPCADAPLEFTNAKADPADLAHNEGSAGRALAKLGIYRYAHPRYALVARRHGGLLSGLGKHLEGRLQSITGSPTHISVERVILRARGALVLSLCDKTRNERYICRIGTTKPVDRVISRNTRILKRIHGLSALHKDHKEKVPHPVSAGTYEGRGFYLETAKPGMLAWRVAATRQALNKTILNDALAFVYGLHCTTQRAVIISPQRYEALIGNELARLAGALSALGVNTGALIAIDDRMKRHFLGRTTFLVWGHGDYGYGNLLCAPDTGRLQGVIDWDTFLSVDLPAVDYLNLLLQQERPAHGGSIAPALSNLWCDLKADGPGTAALVDCYRRAFSLTKSDFCLYVCVAAIRIMGRATPYASEFKRDLTDYVSVLKTILDLLAADSTICPTGNRDAVLNTLRD